jgi:hypothetical protein
MPEDQKTTQPEQEREAGREDPLADRLDDLDPEDLGEDVSGGGFRPKTTMMTNR